MKQGPYPSDGDLSAEMYRAGPMPGAPPRPDQGLLIDAIAKIVDELMQENAQLRGRLDELTNDNRVTEGDRLNRLEMIVSRFREYRNPANRINRG